MPTSYHLRHRGYGLGMSSSPQSTHRSARSRTAALLVVAALSVGAVACSSDETTASTCDDAKAFATSLRGLLDVDLVSTGTDGLTAAVDDVETSWAKLDASASEQFGDQVDALDSAVSEAVDTIEGLPQSDSISDAASSVQSSIDAVSTAWTSLQTAISSELEGCDLSGS